MPECYFLVYALLCTNFFSKKDKNMPLYHSVRICLTNYYIGVAVFLYLCTVTT